MDQSKTTFVVDNFITLENRAELKKATKWANLLSILYVVEPWPEDTWRMYVRKESGTILADLDSVIHG